MKVDYQVWYKWGDTKEELEKKEWTYAVCFVTIKEPPKSKPRFFEAKFNNILDMQNMSISTIEWLKEFTLSDKATEGIVSFSVNKKYYTIILDMNILSYEWAFSILTLFRYPGEYYNICWNYQKVREKVPHVEKWIALYLAHQGTWETEYYQTFLCNFGYNAGHTLFNNGQRIININEKRIYKQLDDYSSYYLADYPNIPLPYIQPIWGGLGYSALLNFEEDTKGTHIDGAFEEEKKI